MSYYQKVKQFMVNMGQPAPETPTVPDLDTLNLRWKLIHEEVQELYDEVFNLSEDNLADYAKEIADLLYVVVGLAVTSGIDIDAVFDAVHRSNLSKFPVTMREDGKVLKGPNYVPPNIEKVINDQRIV